MKVRHYSKGFWLASAALALLGLAWGVSYPHLKERGDKAAVLDYDRNFRAFLAKAVTNVGKETIKVERLSDQFTVPQKLTIKGTPYEIGLTIGHIGAQAHARLPLLAETNRALNQQVIALYQRIYPPYLELVRGVAAAYNRPAEQIDLGCFEYNYTSHLWCGLLNYAGFYRATDFGKFGDTVENHHCSVASYYTNGHQIVGRNFDNESDRPHYFTTTEMTGTYKVMGHTIYGITSWAVDGINEKGLALCVSTAYDFHEPYPREPAILMAHMMQIVMQTCATVDEALALLGTVRVWFPDEGNHWLMADATGKSVIVEWNKIDHKLIIFDKPGPYELMTNTPMQEGEEVILRNCWRYRKAKPLLEAGIHNTTEMFELMKSIRITSGGCRTLWTCVMDVNARTFEVHYFKEYDRKYEFKF